MGFCCRRSPTYPINTMIYDHAIEPAMGFFFGRLHEGQTKTKGGLHLPLSAASRGPTDEEVDRASYFQLDVVRLGHPGVLNDSGADAPTPVPDLQVGDTVLVRSGFGAMPCIVDGHKCFIAPYTALMARVTPLEEVAGA